MSALDRKLMRDLWRMRGQAVAAALIIASAVALLIMSLSALSSLTVTADAYYERHRFAHVFAYATRAPQRVADRLRDVPGVQTVETRVSAITTVYAPDAAEPVAARLVSLPDIGDAVLNRLWISAGRRPAPRRTDEAVLLAPFAEAHGLVVGDRVDVLLDGAKRSLRVVGLGLSPEFVYNIAPGGLMPDEARFGVVWMSRKALGAAYDLDGAFNDVALSLSPGADADAAIDRVDAHLARYGGTGAVTRADQISNWFLTNELDQLRTQATVLPTIFLVAAIFLTQNLLSRLIETERREIALMKAFGYTHWEVGLHYAKLAVAIASLGVFAGWGIGAALGYWHTAVYAEIFRFPFLMYRPSAFEFALSAAVSLGAATLGAWSSVRSAVRMRPAEAMRPPSPESFRGSLDPTLVGGLDTPTRILVRQIFRSPKRAASTVLGVALSVAVLCLTMQWTDAIDRLATSQFHEVQRQHVTLSFHDVKPMRAMHEVSRLPGVMASEPMRVLPATFRSGARSHRGAVTGLPQTARLHGLNDARGQVLPPPRAGLVISDRLAERLGIGPGDLLEMEIMDGERPVLRRRVSATLRTWIDMPVYMPLDELNRALGDPPTFSLAQLLVDPAGEPALLAELKEMPGLSAVLLKRVAYQKFHDTLGEVVLVFIGFFTVFASALTIGVLYNALRITLSERGRELATLRVLGFSRGEIAYILLGEAALLTLLALPLGVALGAALTETMAFFFATDLFRLPAQVSPGAVGRALAVTLVAAVASGLLLRRRIDRLDLIAVLKTRE